MGLFRALTILSLHTGGIRGIISECPNYTSTSTPPYKLYPLLRPRGKKSHEFVPGIEIIPHITSSHWSPRLRLGSGPTIFTTHGKILTHRTSVAAITSFTALKTYPLTFLYRTGTYPATALLKPHFEPHGCRQL